ncbi:MAG: DNA repair protein RadA [Chloroflexi bacterium]|nr:DNA repair protein RadA [Chloroflexota bacterium]
MARLESRYVCQACGASTLRWEGQCRSCGEWNTLVETLVRDAPRRAARVRGAAARPAGGDEPVPLTSLAEREVGRLASGIGEFDRVLGGGFVAGSVVLLGGEPGIGKSTLVLEAAAGVTPQGQVLYASGEESTGQLRLRAGRLGIADGSVGQAIQVVGETDVDRIVEQARQLRPGLLIVDSVQTLTVDGLDGPAGSVGQVREATARLVEHAKATGTPTVLVGHVTKEGSLAGPKTLEHLVDAVLTLEGERYAALRLLRATKNRFGSTEEIGVFEMTERGLREVSDPARAFLGDGTREATAGASGVAVAATLEGSRPLLIEVQTLVAPAAYGSPRRTVAGLDPNRLALLVAVLGRRAGIGLGSHDVYASLTGGVEVGEPALDLPLALALASSLRDRPLVAGLVACGEVGLVGELRPVVGLERRLREAARLGFTLALVPASGSGPVSGATVDRLQVMAVRTLREAIGVGLDPSRPAAAGVDEPVTAGGRVAGTRRP